MLTLLVTFLVPQVSQAVDVDYDGYFRSRSNFFYNLDLDRKESPNGRNFTDMRFRLDPKFYVTDKIRIMTSLNFLDGYLGSKPLNKAPYANPAQSNDRSLDVSETESILDRSSAEMSSEGGITIPDSLVTTTDFTPLQLRRAWAEIDLPYGTLMIGRMPFHLGLGIYANNGDLPSQEVGTTRDRIVFDTNFGPYYARPGIGWLVEGALDRSNDDFMEYFFTLGRTAEHQEIAMHISLNNQKRYNPDTTVTTTSDLANRGSLFWVFDFYAKNKFSFATIGAEVALFSGKASGRKLLAINSAVQADIEFSRWNFLFEGGFSSGTKKSEVEDGKLRTISFNRDYNVALLLFEEALPGGKQTKNSAGAVTAQATSPHSGAVSNAFYPRLKVSYDVARFFKPSLNLIAAYSAEKPIDGSGRFFGVEYDLMTDWPITDYFTVEASFGHFFPGSFYKHVAKPHPSMLLRMGASAHF